jgi:hypothetical protein
MVLPRISGKRSLDSANAVCAIAGQNPDGNSNRADTVCPIHFPVYPQPAGHAYPETPAIVPRAVGRNDNPLLAPVLAPLFNCAGSACTNTIVSHANPKRFYALKTIKC